MDGTGWFNFMAGILSGLHSLRLFFVGTRKIEKYRNRPDDLQDLKNKIRKVIQNASLETLPKVYANAKSHLNSVIYEKEGHFEHLIDNL